MDQGPECDTDSLISFSEQSRFCLLQNCTLLRVLNAGCPADFTYLSSVNGCYKVITDRLTWDVAALRCRTINKNAHLVFVNSANEQIGLSMILNNFNGKYLWCVKITKLLLELYVGFSNQQMGDKRPSSQHYLLFDKSGVLIYMEFCWTRADMIVLFWFGKNALKASIHP